MKKDQSLTTTEPSKALPRIINVDQIQIAPTALQRINIGDVESFTKMIGNQNMTGEIQGIVWNEERITVLTNNPSVVLQFYPEINPGVKVFMHKKEAKRRDPFFGVVEGPVVWDGEFDPVQFTKQNLIKFLKAYSSGLSEDMVKIIKNTKIQEKRSEEEELIDLDGDSRRVVIEESSSTNIPKRFSIQMPLIYNLDGSELISTTLDFEVSVGKKKDDFDRPTNQPVFELRCLNGRKALQGMMYQIIGQLPANIPKYYGASTTQMPKM